MEASRWPRTAAAGGPGLPGDRLPYLVAVATAFARSRRPAAEEAFDAAQMLVGMQWNRQGSWAAAVTVVRADLAYARGDAATASQLLGQAAQGLARAGHTREARRCAARVASA